MCVPVVQDQKPNTNKDAKQEPASSEVDLDLNDAELADAALKIQSGFRGHQARKEIQVMKVTFTSDLGVVLSQLPSNLRSGPLTLVLS